MDFKKRCDTAEQCLPVADYRIMLARLHNDMLAEIDRLKSNDKLMHETNCKLSLLALEWKNARISRPVSGKIVLIHTVTEQLKKPLVLRAVWYARFTEEAGDDEYEAGEYCEEKDNYFVREGWYEFNQYEDVHWAVSEEVTHWAEIPMPPAE